MGCRLNKPAASATVFNLGCIRVLNLTASADVSMTTGVAARRVQRRDSLTHRRRRRRDPADGDLARSPIPDPARPTHMGGAAGMPGQPGCDGHTQPASHRHRVTSSRDTLAHTSYLARLLAAAGTTPAACRQTRLTELVNYLDPKLTAAALGMNGTGATRWARSSTTAKQAPGNRWPWRCVRATPAVTPPPTTSASAPKRCGSYRFPPLAGSGAVSSRRCLGC